MPPLDILNMNFPSNLGKFGSKKELLLVFAIFPLANEIDVFWVPDMQ